MQVFTTSQFNDISTALKSGKAVIIPTDTVWGIIATHQDIIYTIKERPASKKISVFIAQLSQANIPKDYQDVLSHYVPGGLSFIYKDKSYRIPKSELIIRLVNELGPLYQSSANISGKIPITSIEEATQVFKDKKDLVIVRPPDGWKYQNVSSTIINLDNLTLVRQGLVNGEEVLNKLKKGIK